MYKKIFFVILFFFIPTTMSFAVVSSDLIIKNSTSNTVTGLSQSPSTIIPGTESLVNANTQTQPLSVTNTSFNYFSLAPTNNAGSIVSGTNNNVSAIISATNQNTAASNLIVASQSAIVASHVSDSVAATVMAAQAAGIQTETVGNKVIDKATGNEVVGTPKNLTIIQNDGTTLSVAPTDDQIKTDNALAKASGSNQEYVKTEQVVTYDQRQYAGPTYTNDGTSSVCTTNGCSYTLMAPLGGLLGDSNGKYVIKKDDKNGLCSLLNSWYRIGIALAGMLAVVMIVLGGFQYATTDSLFGKEDGKGKIQNALWGLLLALTTWVIINTVNPALTNCTINAGSVTLSKLQVQSSAISLLSAVDPTLGVVGAAMSAADTASNKSWGKDYGSIAANTQAGNGFPNSDWNSAASEAIKSSGILDLPASDAAKYFPDGKVTAEGYVSLLASIAKTESGFNAADNTTAHAKDGKSSFSSEGLLSLSVGDSAVKNLAAQKGVSPQDIINDPVTNIQAGVAILKSQVQKSGTITGGSSSGYWGPLRRGE